MRSCAPASSRRCSATPAIWLKLGGNPTFNPISALTYATPADIFRYPLGRELAVNMMREAQAVAEKIGASFRVSLEQRLDGGSKFFDHVHCGSPGYLSH